MLVALTALIIATSSLNAAPISTEDTASHESGESCLGVLKQECELAWSREQQTFLPHSFGNSSEQNVKSFFAGSIFGTNRDKSENFEDTASTKRLCIQAPSEHHVLLRIELKPNTVDASLNPKSGCDSSSNSQCKVACVTIQDQLNARPDQGRQTFAKEDMVTTVPKLISNSSGHPIQRGRNKHTNMTQKSENIQRFPRHPRASIVRKFYHSDKAEEVRARRLSHTQSTRASSRRQNNCRKCGQSTKQKHMSKRFRARVIKLLFKYRRLLLSGDKDQQRHMSSHDEAINNSSGGISRRLALHKLRDEISSFVKSGGVSPERDNRHQNSSRNGQLIRHQSLTLMRNKLNTPRSPTTFPVNHNLKKAKNSRHKREKRFANDLLNEPTHALPFSYFSICGFGTSQNVSNGNGESEAAQPDFDENSTLVRVIRRFSDQKEETSVKTNAFNILPSHQPFLVSSVGQFVNIEVVKEPESNDALLQHLLIKISFVSNDDTMPKQLASTDPKQRTVVETTIEARSLTSQPASVESTAASDADGRFTSPKDDNLTKTADRENAHIKIAIGTSVVIFVLVILLAGVSTYRSHRRMQRCRNTSHRSHPSCNVRSEEQVYASSKPEMQRSHKSKIRQNNACLHSNSTPSREEQIRMLEYHKAEKCPGRGKHHKEDIGGHRAHTRKHQATPKCSKHLHVSSGLTQHNHCVVCQIAENPHQPMTAQYVSEFLPPASRQNNIGLRNTASPTSNNFERFNRLANNPYRYSPKLSGRHTALPSTIHLPDGEEIYKSNLVGIPGSANAKSRMLPAHDQILSERKNAEVTACAANDACRKLGRSIKSPPNRTVFRSDNLPFDASENSRKSNGYPGPPSGAVDYSHTRGTAKDKCICEYIWKHLEESPPEYSDVIRDDLKETSLRNEDTVDALSESDVSTALLGNSQPDFPILKRT